MSLPDPVNFFHSLATHLATAASLTYAAGSGKSDLFRNVALEKWANDPYSVMTVYAGGPRLWENNDRVAIQVMTVATQTKQDLGLGRARAIYNALRDADGYPARMRKIDGKKATDGSSDGHWMIVAAELLQTPGLIGRLDDGKVEISFNFEVEFLKVD